MVLKRDFILLFRGILWKFFKVFLMIIVFFSVYFIRLDFMDCKLDVDGRDKMYFVVFFKEFFCGSLKGFLVDWKFIR